jgi:aspartyl/asparaginyl-tRNA synthetase
MKKLLKIALILSFLGILLLLFLSTQLEQKTISINETSDFQEYQKVKIQGEIKSIKELTPHFFILNVQDKTGNISITLNSQENLKEKINLSKTNLAEITGKLSYYKKTAQVSAEKIILLKEAKNAT